jgi:hypothetical protein
VAVWVALPSSGCAGLFGSGVGAAVGGIAEDVVGEEAGDGMRESTPSLVSERPETETPIGVYLAGPVPGWEYSNLRSTPSRAIPALFEANVFGGACPGLNITGGKQHDPFSGGPPLRLHLFETAPSHTVDVHYYRFGEVRLAGPPDPGAPWQFIGMPGQAAGACAFVGVSLLTIGPRPVRHVILR